MQATLPDRAAMARHPGLIAAAVVAVGALAAAAALLAAPPRASWASSPGPQGAASALVPVGIVGDSAVAGDPSVPSAASVFLGRPVPADTPVDSF